MERTSEVEADEFDLNAFEAERWRMMRLVVWAGVVGFVGMAFGAVAMYPEAAGFVVGIGYMSWAMGFAVGRFVFRQQRDRHESEMAGMAKSVARMEDLMTKGARSALEGAYKSLEQQRARNDELSEKLKVEREARVKAQREYAQHIRDCRLG